MNKKALIPMAILATLAVPGIADAHNATATPSCGGLQWNAVNFDKTVTNSIVVKVDDATVHQDLDFKSSDAGTSSWSQTASHTWSVVINAPGTQYDRNFSGTWQPCQSTTTAASSTTVPATTTTASSNETTPSVAPSTAPSTSVAPTTSVVEVCCVVVPSTAPPSSVADVSTLTPVEPVLPRTGGGLFTVAIAVVIAVFGVGCVVLARRRP